MADELCQFLSPSARMDLRSTALEYVLGLTGSPEGVRLLSGHPRALQQLLDMGGDTSQQAVSRDAHLALLNASADPQLAESLVSLGGVPCLLKQAVDPEWLEKQTRCV